MRKLMLITSFVLSCAALPAFGQSCAGFTDVLATDSFCSAVTWMKTRGITTGCGGGGYCPQLGVTRAQMALFMYRFGHRDDILLVAPTGDGAFPDAAFAVKQTANTAAGITLFTHVILSADGPTDNVAVYVTGGAITIEEGRVGAGGSGGTGAGVAIAADAAGVTAKVRNSLLSAGLAATPRYSALVDNGGTMFIENTQLGGNTSGAPTCFNTYNPGFVAKPCL